MKKNATKSRVGGKSSSPQDDGSAQRLMESYNKFFQTWSNFRQDMEDQIDHNLKRQQKMYDDFFGRWNRFAGEMGSRLSKDKVNESQREFYDVWRNYANKIGPRLTRAMNDGMQSYGSISASLDKYSKKIGEEVQDLLERSWEPSKLEKLYDSWLELGTTIRKQMENTMGQGRLETDQLSKTWFEFSSRMQQLVSSMNEKSGAYTDLWQVWQKSSKDIGDSIIEVVNGTSHDIDKLQKTWMGYYTKVEKEMSRLAQDIGVAYEDLYVRFLDQQSRSLGHFGEWWQTATEAAKKEFIALEKRLLDLEKRVKETKR